MMTTEWPSFVTRDLGDSLEDAEEMERRWQEYDRQMKALIAKGGVHQDEDGWWIDTASGALIGPDPEIERPWTDADFARARPAMEVLDEVLPELADAIRRGRPPSENPKTAVSIRLDTDLLERLKADGPGWQTRANTLLREAMGL